MIKRTATGLSLFAGLILMVACDNPQAKTKFYTDNPPIIEFLTFQVDAEDLTAFLSADARTWTRVLATHGPIIKKEVWIKDPEKAEVVMAITWAKQEDWDNFPKVMEDRAEKELQQLMPPGKKAQLVKSERMVMGYKYKKSFFDY